ncbi:MAG: hypothetical protein ABSB14_22795 [Candidatus Sulfotelmatobacter sp.]|jgi:hypothetical protein
MMTLFHQPGLPLYDSAMLLRLSGVVAVLATVLASVSCERHRIPPPDTVVVRVYRDRESDFARQLDRKLYEFTSEHHTTRSGKWIFIATVEPHHYAEELGGKVATIKPQLVVLDQPRDASLIRGMDVNITRAISACGANRMCPTFIPSWVSGEQLEAAKQVLDAISAESH